MAAVIWVILLPFVGTALGAGSVYILKKPAGAFSRQCLSGLAAGVMVAASIWSLLLPALEGSAYLGRLSCLPVLAGLWCGVWFLRILDRVIPWLHRGQADSTASGNRMLTLAVTLHNLPEGMAVGVAAAAMLSPSYFSSSFKRYTGYSLIDYTNAKRVRLASKLLLNEQSSSISEIAMRVGLNNMSNFNRAFRKYIGCTPSEYISNNNKPKK